MRASVAAAHCSAAAVAAVRCPAAVHCSAAATPLTSAGSGSGGRSLRWERRAATLALGALAHGLARPPAGLGTRRRKARRVCPWHAAARCTVHGGLSVARTHERRPRRTAAAEERDPARVLGPQLCPAARDLGVAGTRSGSTASSMAASEKRGIESRLRSSPTTRI
ncbi:unnamed protein product [Urochloa humidicola]